MIEIKPYGPQWEQLHEEFARRHWTKRRRLIPEYIYWKFRGTPEKELTSFILAIDQGKVIGQLGLVPCIVNVKGELVEAQWACDLMVDHNYRGAGVAKLLYEHAYTVRPLTLGSDASPAATISMTRAGFIQLKGPWKFFFAFQLGALAKLKGRDLKWLNHIRNPFTYAMLVWRFIRGLKKKYKLINTESSTEHKHISGFWPDKKLSVLHDSSFVRWRYASFLDYYSGIRLFKNSNCFYSVYTAKDLFIITDWGARGFFEYVDLWSEIVSRAYQEKITKIKVLANTPLQSKILLLLGSIRFRTRTEIIYYTTNKNIDQLMMGEYFHYTYMDSDENI